MNKKINKILFASDLTERAWAVFEYATDLSFNYGANIVIHHVIEDYSHVSKGLLENFLGSDLSQKVETRKFEEAKSTLTDKNRKALELKNVLSQGYKEWSASTPSDGHSIVIEDVIVTEGEITGEIAKQARDSSCDLIVMGTQATKHGLAAGKYSGVIKSAQIPVLVIPTE